jgi:cytochrome c-type biogenesis protein CcmH
MTAFHVTAFLMVGLAWLFVLPALLKPATPKGSVQQDALNLHVLRDQLRELDVDVQRGTIDPNAYQSAREELVQRVAEDVHAPAPVPLGSPRQRWSAVAVGLVIPVLAVSLYGLLGTPKALDPATLVAQPSPGQAGQAAVSPAQIEAMVARLAEKLKTQPDDANGWRMLARSYETLRRFDQAVDAYRHLLQLAPNDADALVDYAVTLAMSSGQSLSGEPEKLIHRALAIDPGNVQALALAGSAAFERRDYAQAIQPWRKILAQAPADSDIARSIAASIAKAEALAAAPSAKADR